MDRLRIALALVLSSALIGVGFAVSDHASTDASESPSGVHSAAPRR